MAAALYVRARDNVVPGNFSVDFNDAADMPGPFMVSISAWVTTADLLAGIEQFSVNYDDPTASSRQVQFGALPQLTLADPTSFFATEFQQINRLSGSSIWTFDSALVFGITGNALISYRIVHTAGALTDIQPW